MTMHDQLQLRLEELDGDQSLCVGCGLCLEGCPTFLATGWEHESPRGRIRLAQELMHGRIRPQAAALDTFNDCLHCRACEPLCPTRVPVHRLAANVREIRQLAIALIQR